MKTLKKQIRPITILFAFIMLVQSCSVYKSSTISMYQAVQNESKVKVKTFDNEKLKFDRISIEDNKYYGVKKENNQVVKTPLKEDLIKSVNEKDKTLSTLLSIGVPVVIVGGILAIAAANCCAVDLSNADWSF